jgi:hypothetical protein
MKQHRNNTVTMWFRHSAGGVYSPWNYSDYFMKESLNAIHLVVGAPAPPPACGPVAFAPPMRFENSAATSGGIPPGPVFAFWFACVPFVTMTKIPAMTAMVAMTTRISVTGETDCFMMYLRKDASLRPG